MSAEQRGHLTPASAPCHGANKKNQPGHASPGGVQTHCRGQAGPFLPQSCFSGTATARSWGGGGQFCRKCGEQQQLKSEQNHDLLLLLHDLFEPSLAKLFLPLPGRVGSRPTAITCMREVSSVERICRPGKDNLFRHPSASLHPRIWISAGGWHIIDCLTFNRTLQCLCADFYKTP